MKALVIENQYEQDAEIDGLIKDHPDLFSDVTVITGALHYPPEQLIQEVDTHDALIISSTFMHKDQLEEMVELLVKIEPKTIFVRLLSDKIEDWQKGDAYLWFDNYEKFIDNISTCLHLHKVYEFNEEWEDKTIQDDVWKRMKYSSSTGRGKFKIKKITSL